MKPGSGYLEVTCVGAKGLKKKQQFGVQDPYAVLRLGKKEAKTRTHKDGGSDPQWNQTISVPCAGEDFLRVEIMNENVLVDGSIGGLDVPLNAVYHAGKSEGSYAVLSSKGRQHGFITLKLKYIPDSGLLPSSNENGIKNAAAANGPPFKPPLQPGSNPERPCLPQSEPPPPIPIVGVYPSISSIGSYATEESSEALAPDSSTANNFPFPEVSRRANRLTGSTSYGSAPPSPTAPPSVDFHSGPLPSGYNKGLYGSIGGFDSAPASRGLSNEPHQASRVSSCSASDRGYSSFRPQSLAAQEFGTSQNFAEDVWKHNNSGPAGHIPGPDEYKSEGCSGLETRTTFDHLPTYRDGGGDSVSQNVAGGYANWLESNVSTSTLPYKVGTFSNVQPTEGNGVINVPSEFGPRKSSNVASGPLPGMLPQRPPGTYDMPRTPPAGKPWENENFGASIPGDGGNPLHRAGPIGHMMDANASGNLSWCQGNGSEPFGKSPQRQAQNTNVQPSAPPAPPGMSPSRSFPQHGVPQETGLEVPFAYLSTNDSSISRSGPLPPSALNPNANFERSWTPKTDTFTEAKRDGGDGLPLSSAQDFLRSNQTSTPAVGTRYDSRDRPSTHMDQAWTREAYVHNPSNFTNSSGSADSRNLTFQRERSPQSFLSSSESSSNAFQGSFPPPQVSSSNTGPSEYRPPYNSSQNPPPSYSHYPNTHYPHSSSSSYLPPPPSSPYPSPPPPGYPPQEYCSHPEAFQQVSYGSSPYHISGYEQPHKQGSYQSFVFGSGPGSMPPPGSYAAAHQSAADNRSTQYGQPNTSPYWPAPNPYPEYSHR